MSEQKVQQINSPANVIAGSRTKTPVLDFYIFGNKISHSLSPTLHNTGFRKLQFPGFYRIFETEHADESVRKLMSRTDFGGASVTFPHKLEVRDLVDTISDRARTIGAINTIVVNNTPQGRSLHGENTDWSGIKCCIERGNIESLKSSSAVILGAGGAARAACYAAQELNIGEIIIVNRTQRTAQAVADSFPKLRTSICMNLEEAQKLAHAPIRVIIGCVPADELSEDKIPTNLFDGSESGVLVEMAYRPLVTGLMQVAGKYPGWRVFKGMDVLQEQAFAQFELWTGKKAPKEAMETAMAEELERRQKGKM